MSCIVPAYNAELYLPFALDSILSQTLPPYELIVVDDGSTDGTAGVLESYQGRVTVLTGPNQGSGPARNRGIAAASGDFLSFLDADDLWLPTKLERQMARFAARPELGVSVTMVRNFWIPELAYEAERHAGKRFAGPLPGYGGTTLLARADVFATIGDFSTITFAEDTEWFTRVIDAGVEVEMIDEVLVLRRIHQGNQSFVHSDQLSGALLEVVRRRLVRKRFAAGLNQQ